MARERVRAAARKAALRLADVQVDEADEIAAGVRAVGKELAPLVRPGALYWTAPLQYVAEQMAPRVCAAHGLPVGAREDVALYLLSAMNEYIVALVGEFDAEHFAAWIGAEGGGRTG